MVKPWPAQIDAPVRLRCRALQRRLQIDIGVEHPGHRTIFLRIRCDFIEPGAIDSRHLRIESKVHGRNRPIALNLLQREVRLRSQPLGREPRLAQRGG